MAKVLAFTSSVPNVLEDSQGRRVAFGSLLEALEFLYEPFDGFKVTADLDTFIAPVLRLLEIDEAKELHSTGTVKIAFNNPRGGMIVYKLRYFDGKFFQVKRLPEDYESVFYHLQQFSFSELPQNLDTLKSFGEQVIAECTAMGFYPHNLNSAISILQPYLSHMDIPTYLDIKEDEVMQYAQHCGNRQWVEAHKLGYFPHVYDYDLSSAFSRIHASLLDFRRGTFTKTAGFDQTATYGYCNCHVHIFDHVTVSPIVYRDPSVKEVWENALTSPVGEWNGYHTKAEIDFIRQYKLGEVTVYDGWYWHPDPKQTQIQPMAPLVARLMKHKQSGVPIRVALAKMMLVGMWGKTGQYNDKTRKVGKFFNPPWRAEFTSRTSLNVARMIYRHKAMPNLVHVATDGILVDKPIELTELDISEGWKTNYEGDAIMVSSGLVYYSGKHPKSIYMDQVRDMVSDDLLSCRWKRIHKKIVTLGEAIQWNEIGQLGLEHDFDITLDLSLLNHTRSFKKFPTTGRQLLSEQFVSTPRKIRAGSLHD